MGGYCRGGSLKFDFDVAADERRRRKFMLGESRGTQTKLETGNDIYLNNQRILHACMPGRAEGARPKMIVKHVVRGLRTLYPTRPEHVKMTEPTKPVPDLRHRESFS
jgi:hypothetical protein